jgi:hypothetical protein
MARRLNSTGEAFSWLFDGNEIVGGGASPTHTSRETRPQGASGGEVACTYRFFDESSTSFARNVA